MTGGTCSRNTERRWRHLANWLWLSPVVWSFIGGTWYATTKDLAGPTGLIFLPWWVLVGGILAYLLATIRMRWGTTPVIALVTIGWLTGLGVWFLAGIHAALWCGLIVPTMIANGCLRIPPWETGASRSAIVAALLGIAEPALVLSFVLAVVMLYVHLGWMSLAGATWWWVLGGTSLVLLVWSQWLLRRWRRRAADAGRLAVKD